MTFQLFKQTVLTAFKNLSDEEILAFIENLLPAEADTETMKIDDLIQLYFQNVEATRYSNMEKQVKTRVMSTTENYLTTRQDLVRYYTGLFGDNPYILTHENNIWTYIGFSPAGPYTGEGYGVYIFNTCDVYIGRWMDTNVVEPGILCTHSGEIIKDLYIDDESLLCYNKVVFSNNSSYDIGELTTIPDDDTFDKNPDEQKEAENFTPDYTKQEEFIELFNKFGK